VDYFGVLFHIGFGVYSIIILQLERNSLGIETSYFLQVIYFQ